MDSSSKSLKLSIVDQSPVHGTREPYQAPLDSIELAKYCDDLGYSRYWLAEHHNSNQFAGPCPEILMTRIAAETKNMRIGSGGVMLSHYSPNKVAEIFRMLETLYPGRIDLGIGRAPGGDKIATASLAEPHANEQSMKNDYFPQQASDLVNFLRSSFDSTHPFSSLAQLPDDKFLPELWMLGSGGGSSSLGGLLGMGLAVARFIAPDHCSPSIFDNYKTHFQQAGHEHEPSCMLAIAATCAETEEEAKFIASTAAYRKTMTSFGKKTPLFSPEQVADAYKNMNQEEQSLYDHVLDKMTCGTPDQCAEEMTQLANEYNLNEISIVTVSYDFNQRKESYRLLANQLC
jgi:luciferase family oxidoreductase group 1